MGRLAVLALRVVLAAVLLGTLFVQIVMVPLIDTDLAESETNLVAVRVPVVVICVLGLVTVQITAVCVWQLLAMVARGTVFSHAAFRYVHIMIGAAAAASLLTFGLAVTLAPGEAVAPGMVLLICGAALGVAGIALIIFVLRMLLAQAVARDAEARHLRAELEEVI